MGLTDAIKWTTQELAEGAGRAVVHLRSSRTLKEELALAISAADRVSQGLLCVLLRLEPCQPTQWQGRRVRALAPLSAADGALLAAVARSEFAIHGFRNRDLRALQCGETPSDPAAAKRQAARVTRQLRLLRGHGLIR